MARNFDGWDDGGTPMWRARRARSTIILDDTRKRLSFGTWVLAIFAAGILVPMLILVVGFSAMGIAHAWFGW